MIKFSPAAANGCVSVIAIISGMTALPAIAQDRVSDPNLADIVVTAQRRTQSLQDVPVSATVVSGADLADHGIRSLADLSGQMASVKIQPGPASDQLHIRGVGSGYNAGFEQSVATFVDGAYRNRGRSSRLAMFDVERVEVLKGPQTIYFGANAIAGALNITTRRPSLTPEANVSALLAVPDREYNIEGGFSMPVTDNLAFRVAGSISGMRGYIKNVRYDKWGPNLDDKQGRISLHYNSGNFTVDARYDIARTRDRNTYESEILDCPPPVTGVSPAGICATLLATAPNTDWTLNRRSDSGEHTFSRIDLDEAVTTARLDLDAFSIISTTAYEHQNAAQRAEQAPYPGTSVSGTPASLPYQTNERFHQFSQEIRVQSKTGGRFEYIFGGYYEDNRLQNLTAFSLYFVPLASLPPLSPFLPSGTRVYPLSTSYQHSSTLSAFGALTLNATDKLSATIGLRYSRVRKEGALVAAYGSGGYFFDQEVPFTPFSVAGQNAVANFFGLPRIDENYAQPKRVDDAFMPSLNVKWNMTPDVMAYASFSRGFKAGGYAISTLDTFGPERAKAYEVGLKARFLDRRLTTSIALFQTDYKDLQEAQTLVTPSGALIPQIGNVGGSRSRGIEFSGRLRASQDLTFRTEIAYVDSYYTSFPNAPCSQIEAAQRGVSACSKDASGQRRPFAPLWSGSVGAEYTRDLNASLKLGLDASLSFTSSYYLQAAISPILQQPSFTKLDARLSLGSIGGRWEVAIIGRNLTDKLTAAYLQDLAGSQGSAFGIADRPRSVALQVNLKW